MAKFVFSLGIIVCGLSLGYLIQHLANTGRLALPISQEVLRKTLQKSALLFVFPITIIGAIWVVRVQAAAIATLPLLGFGAIMLGGISALAAARLLRLPPYKSGALYCCGSFTNIGAIGALICYVYLGEPGFALVQIYRVFEDLTYYSIGFPIAKYYSGSEAVRRGSVFIRLKGLLKDPYIIVAVSSILIGGLLNLSGLPRPGGFRMINTIFIPLGTGMLLVSIGLSMQFKRVKDYLKECLAVAGIKFLIVPLTIGGLAYLIGYGKIENGLPLKVVIVLTTMPVAFSALIPPSIYDLDLDLANACWFFTTACLIWVLPTLLIVIELISS